MTMEVKELLAAVFTDLDLVLGRACVCGFRSRLWCLQKGCCRVSCSGRDQYVHFSHL